MNTNLPSDLETLLRGLQPRHPSPGVKEALFITPPSRRRPNDDGPVNLGRLRVWLAPVAVAGLCALSLATVSFPGSVPGARALAAVHPVGAWRSPVVQVERNALPRPSFRSTTGAGVASSFGSLLLRQTNVFVR